MSATAFNGFIDALVAALQARAGLAGVRVFSAPADPSDVGEEAIILAPETSVIQSPAAMSSTHITEEFTVKGLILCYAAQAPGADPVSTVNAAAKVARDRAIAILEEVTDELAGDMTVSGSVLAASISELDIKQGPGAEEQLGRVCSVEFSIAAEAHTTP